MELIKVKTLLKCSQMFRLVGRIKTWNVELLANPYKKLCYETQTNFLCPVNEIKCDSLEKNYCVKRCRIWSSVSGVFTSGAELLKVSMAPTVVVFEAVKRDFAPGAMDLARLQIQHRCKINVSKKINSSWIKFVQSLENCWNSIHILAQNFDVLNLQFFRCIQLVDHFAWTEWHCHRLRLELIVYATN